MLKKSVQSALNNEKLHLWFLAGVCALSTLIFYIPFMFGDFTQIFRSWDGPNYVYVAKTLYNIPANHPFAPYKTTPEYFACHLPLYPMFIRLFSFMGYMNSMLFVTLLFKVLSTLTLYMLLKETKSVKSPLWSAAIALFIPARYLLNHSIGATEAPFLFFIFSSMLAHHRGRYILAYALGGFAGITRIVGVLIGAAYFIMTALDRKKWKYAPALALVILPLLATFTFYHFRFGDFFAYFSWNAKLLAWRPAQIFLAAASSGNKHDTEFYIIMYAVYGFGVAMLWRRKTFFWYSVIMYAFCLFIYHDDVSRYFIPIAPFALIVAYDGILSKNVVKWMSIPFIALVFIFAWRMVPHNLVVDWVYVNFINAL